MNIIRPTLRLPACLCTLLCALGCTLSTAAPFDQAEIKDPTASFIDVKARRAFLQQAKPDNKLRAAALTPYDCQSAAPVAPQEGPMLIPGRYLVGNHGAVHPDYERIVALYRDFENVLANLGGLYVVSGKPAYAQCLLNQLALWADAGALLDYNPNERKQAWYQTEWSAGVAAQALSLVITESTLDPDKKQRVLAWLNRVSHKQISEPGADITCCNNHAYWRGLQATMIGVLTNDKELFRWGLGRYAIGIGQIAEDGSLPLEMTRHEQALHYQNYALQPLTMMAEIAARQGIDLYAYSENGRDFHRAVRFVIAAIKDDALIHKYASEKQDRRAFSAGRGDLAWLEYYLNRFPQSDPLGMMGKPFFYPRTGGAVTLLVYTPPQDP
ncbi:MAG: hypothetical protein H6R19_2145 [Proteobacteria bacterium]|nr:hypothetical protein [Pseudomonadota bacterium]